MDSSVGLKPERVESTPATALSFGGGGVSHCDLYPACLGLVAFLTHGGGGGCWFGCLLDPWGGGGGERGWFGWSPHCARVKCYHLRDAIMIVKHSKRGVQVPKNQPHIEHSCEQFHRNHNNNRHWEPPSRQD